MCLHVYFVLCEICYYMFNQNIWLAKSCHLNKKQENSSQESLCQLLAWWDKNKMNEKERATTDTDYSCQDESFLVLQICLKFTCNYVVQSGLQIAVTLQKLALSVLFRGHNQVINVRYGVTWPSRGPHVVRLLLKHSIILCLNILTCVWIVHVQ